MHDVSVTHQDWREPARRLRAATGPATAEQLRIAAALDCPHDDEPRGVLTAVIEDWLRPVLHAEDSLLATERQLAFLGELGHVNASPEMHRTVASAWIDHYLSLRTADALEDLRLKAGDQLHRQHNYVDPSTGEVTNLGETVTVSSIGSNGLVYFRGGNGKCGWPANLRRIHES